MARACSRSASAHFPPPASHHSSEVAHAREVGHERRRLDERAEAAELVGAGRHPLAEQPRLARARTDQPQQHPQARGLARAVRAEQPAHLTALDREAQVVDREHARAEALGQAEDLDDGFGHRQEMVPTERGGSTAASVAWRPMDFDPRPPAPRRATTPRVPGRDAPAVEPAPRSRRLRAVRRPGRRHLVVARALSRTRPRQSCPGSGRATARGQAFYREEDTGPTITLPRRYRTKGVVLHELTHWALGIDSGLPHHGRTFARVLLDAIGEFCGPEHAAVLAASYQEHGVHIARPPRRGPDGRLHYGWDERLRVNKGATGLVRINWNTDGDEHELHGCFDGYERGSSVLRCRAADGELVRIPTKSVWAVARCRLRGPGARSSPRSSPISGSRSPSSSRS